MGVTIHYRGAIANLDRVEDFEDRVLDLALELGGQARIWRTACDHDPSRMVRGLILNLCPGQESTSLLLSPEGWLIGLMEIEDAENGELKEPPWCFVKTQFGTLEGHVALAEMLAALKAEFFPGLEVSDEGDYWETRDVNRLAGKMAFLNAAIAQLSEGFKQHGLTPEAAEDPEILATRITRIAAMVQRTLKRPSEHPPVRWEDDGSGRGDDGPLTPEEEARWDASFKENRRMQERVQRAIEKHLAQGDEYDAAFEAAMREETAGGLPQDESGESTDDEDWRASLPAEYFTDASGEEPFDEDEESFEDEPSGVDSDDGELDAPDRHPLQQRASDLLMRLHLLSRRDEGKSSSFETLMHGACEISGGLAQALGPHGGELPVGLCVVQLKRSLRGAAFALGSLFPLRSEGRIKEDVFEELHTTLQGLQSDVYDELRRQRAGNW
jgi:hypothetical protein